MSGEIPDPTVEFGIRVDRVLELASPTIPLWGADRDEALERFAALDRCVNQRPRHFTSTTMVENVRNDTTMGRWTVVHVDARLGAPHELLECCYHLIDLNLLCRRVVRRPVDELCSSNHLIVFDVVESWVQVSRKLRG